MSREQAKIAVEILVERFKEHQNEYHLPEYNEQKTRQDFINPFFKALGWDIDNEKGASEAYREVIYEDKVIVRGKSKAPDYGFRLAGSGKKRLFYVEAKKPSVSLKANKEAAYQLRRYGSSAQAYVSILTNFEDFIVFDCARVPNLNDSATVARLKHIGFEDYLNEFDFIYDTFSHEAITKGRFDKFVQARGTKKGTDTLDKRFVESLDQWRKYLATSIAVNNKKITDDELNFAVQLIIDRLIFLRFCEDRSVEPYGQLQKAASKGDTFKNLLDLFHQADDKYNSGLFDFDKDKITPGLKLDNKVMKVVVDDLYYPKCNYEFSVMPVEILGNAYEQFLGKVIRITPARGVKIEEKPEVRKAGGVYYTPQYIVEYIVKNTVGKLVEGKSPKEIDKIKIVDPACGSGSFLLGAFEFLLSYYADWYHKNLGERERKKGVILTPEGRLTTHEKKRILLNNIYGVDLDANAVEVSKLSLLLKCMEGETEASIKQQVTMFHERVLPDLDHNIKDGNSIIDTDFYDLKIDLGEERKIKPFSWNREFPWTKSEGGFDVVIGNPPYVFGRDWKALGINEEIKSYLARRFKASPYQLDFFSIFMEMGTRLLRSGGYLGYIVPNVWLTNTYSSTTRKFILGSSSDLTIAVPDKKVFEGITVDTIVYTFKKGSRQSKTFTVAKLVQGSETQSIALDFEAFENGEKPITTSLSTSGLNILEKIKDCGTELSTFANITRGVHPYRTGGYGKSAFSNGYQTQRDVSERPYHSARLKKGFRPFVYGKDLKSFTHLLPQEYISYGTWLAEPRDPSFFEGERVYSRKILGVGLVVTVEKGDSVADQQVYITKPKNQSVSARYLAAILGSRLMGFFIRNYFDEVNDAFPQIKVSQLKSLPIRTLEKKGVANHLESKIEATVDTLMSLNSEMKLAVVHSKGEQLKRKIEHEQESLDKLIYQLYNLTEDEIREVENFDTKNK